MTAKIIHTETFSCADDHPIVYYTFDENNEAICEYCSAKFVYKPKKKLLPLTDHYIPGITERPTPSEKMQDELEPIDDDHVNRVLKGSG